VPIDFFLATVLQFCNSRSMHNPGNEKRYMAIARAIQDKIRVGAIKPGQRLPSVRELMRKYKVSLGTTMQALAYLQSKGWVERIHGKGVFAREPLCSSPLFPGTGGWLMFSYPEISLRGVCVGVICHPYHRDASPQNVCYDRILRGAEYSVQELEGRCHILMSQLGSAADVRSLVDTVRHRHFKALIGVGGHWHGEAIRQISGALSAEGIPLVQVYSDAYPGLRIHRVTVDGAAGMRVVVQHLAELGHHHIGFLGYGDYLWSREREQAVSQALGRPVPGIFVSESDPELRDRLRNELRTLSHSCTALVAANDSLAALARDLLTELGFDVPRRMSLTGFDDDDQFRNLRLTTVGLPLEAVAAAAVQLAAHVLREGAAHAIHDVRLEPRLLIRDTTAPAPEPAADALIQEPSLSQEASVK